MADGTESEERNCWWANLETSELVVLTDRQTDVVSVNNSFSLCSQLTGKLTNWRVNLEKIGGRGIQELVQRCLFLSLSLCNVPNCRHIKASNCNEEREREREREREQRVASSTKEQWRLSTSTRTNGAIRRMKKRHYTEQIITESRTKLWAKASLIPGSRMAQTWRLLAQEWCHGQSLFIYLLHTFSPWPQSSSRFFSARCTLVAKFKCRKKVCTQLASVQQCKKKKRRKKEKRLTQLKRLLKFD